MILCLTFNPLYDKVTANLLKNKWKFGRKPLGGGLNMGDKMRFINCQSLTFSPQLSESRMAQVQESIGAGLIQRILCFALYLLGLNRSDIGQTLGIPPDTAKSIIKAVKRDGLRAFEDRRMKSSTLLPKQASREPPSITLREDDDHLVVDFGIRDRALKLCRRDPLQMKTVLLSMFNSGLLSTRQVAEAIKLTPSHTAALARRLQEQGALSLADQRQGQKEDFVVTPSVKAELIQQFAVDVITAGRTSSTTISEKLKERCGIVVPDRTVRHHLSRLGLGSIKRSLPRLVAAVKKTSNNCSEA
jgi:transposase